MRRPLKEHRPCPDRSRGTRGGEPGRAGTDDSNIPLSAILHACSVDDIEDSSAQEVSYEASEHRCGVLDHRHCAERKSGTLLYEPVQLDMATYLLSRPAGTRWFLANQPFQRLESRLPSIPYNRVQPQMRS